MIADETGSDTETMHKRMKEQFLPKMYFMLGDEKREIDKTTTLLSTDQMEAYLMRVRVWAAEFLNVTIPLPNENLQEPI